MSDTPNRSVSRRSFLTSAGAAGVLALAGCTEGPGSTGTPGSQLSGSITITGSSTVYPVASAVAQRFQQNNPKVDISVTPTGSGGGFSNHFCVGNADFNNASRPITESERQACSDNDIEYHEVNVATDALTVIVNNDNPWVDCMTPEDLRKAWSANGASTWQDINSDWDPEPISRYGAAETSGTFDYFNEAILGEDANHTGNYSATEKDNQIISGVQSETNAIGYLGFSYYSRNTDKVTALSIDNGNGCVSPSLKTAKNGDYKPLSRPLFTYPKKSALAKEHVAEFARFYVEQSANSDLIADEIGYVPKTQDAMKQEKKALNDIISSVQ